MNDAKAVYRLECIYVGFDSAFIDIGNIVDTLLESFAVDDEGLVHFPVLVESASAPAETTRMTLSDFSPEDDIRAMIHRVEILGTRDWVIGADGVYAQDQKFEQIIPPPAA